MGSGRTSMGGFDGEFLAAATNTIVITFNYRLGALGFSYFPGLVTRNLGLDDQTFLLQWVHRNIDAFGGDPSKITLGGESAGAVSLCFHMISPESKSLFSSLLSMSGPCSIDFPTATFVQENIGKKLVENVGCHEHHKSDEALRRCMKAVASEALLHSVPVRRGVFFGKGAFYLPFLGGDDYKTHPHDAILNLELDPSMKGFIFGTCSDEGTLFSFIAFPLICTEEIVTSLTRSMFEGFVGANHTINDQSRAQIMSHYSLQRYQTHSNLISSVMGDAFNCGIFETARVVSSALVKEKEGLEGNGDSSPRVFAYFYSHLPDWSTLKQLKVYHSVDQASVFHQTLQGNSNLSYRDHAASIVMISYLRDFFHQKEFASDPDLPTWRPFMTKSGALQHSDEIEHEHLERVMNMSQSPNLISTKIREEECTLWKTHFPK